jgi:hypothetical protein
VFHRSGWIQEALAPEGRQVTAMDQLPAHIHGTHVPVEEPSTVALAESFRKNRAAFWLALERKMRLATLPPEYRIEQEKNRSSLKYLRSLLRYVPKPYHGKVKLLLCEEAMMHDPTWMWRNVARGGLDTPVWMLRKQPAERRATRAMNPIALKLRCPPLLEHESFQDQDLPFTIMLHVRYMPARQRKAHCTWRILSFGRSE